MSPLRPLAFAAAGAVALTGCSTPFGGDEGASAVTSSTTSTSASSPTPDLGRATRELSGAEARKLLPTKPEGYRSTEVDNDSRWRRTDPEVCVDLLRLGWQGRHAYSRRTARGGASWYTNPDDTETYQAYTVTIDSHSDPVGPGLLGRAGDALGQCGAFALTGTSADGAFDERILAEGLPVRNIGEQTFAVRLTSFVEVGGRTHKLYTDQLVVRVGHNVVTVGSTHYRERSSTRRLEKLADETVENLRR